MKTTLLASLTVLILPAAAFAAEGHGPPEANWTELGSQTLNFLIYIGLIVFLAKKPVAAFFATRRADVAGAIESAKNATAAAEARLTETMAKIDNFDTEREAILAEFRELGDSERRKIVADAESEAAKIVRDAEQTAERELAQARESLRSSLVTAALGKAQSQLTAQMTPVTHAQLIDDGIEALATATN
jgi:F-type H+-transporting ATPase subunit b